MTGALLTLSLIALIALAAICFLAWVCDDECSVKSRVEREQARAEGAIDEEHQAARRAMNDAAGQSWRNLSE